MSRLKFDFHRFVFAKITTDKNPTRIYNNFIEVLYFFYFFLIGIPMLLRG